MENVGVEFTLLPSGEKAPPGWTKSSGHLLFDFSMDFTSKARLVKDGHCNPYTTTLIYDGVVSHESNIILMTHVALI